jgi:hypothetical protein
MIDQNSTWTTKIPASVPSGNYLIRFETIALHSMPAVRLHFDMTIHIRTMLIFLPAILPGVCAAEHHQRWICCALWL